MTPKDSTVDMAFIFFLLFIFVAVTVAVDSFALHLLCHIARHRHRHHHQHHRRALAAWTVIFGSIRLSFWVVNICLRLRYVYKLYAGNSRIRELNDWDFSHKARRMCLLAEAVVLYLWVDKYIIRSTSYTSTLKS